MAAWTLSVSVAGSVREMGGPVVVKAEESTAKVLTCAIVPEVGQTFQPDAYNGQPVTVTYNGGTIFTGVVETARSDLSDGLVRITATDGLKRHFENMSDAQILAAIPGARLSEVVFGDRQSGWESALHAIETTLQEVHFSPAGALVLGDWSTSGGASYTDDDVLYLSESAEQAPNSTLINEVSIVCEYGYSRLKWRQGGWSWVWPTDFCGWLGNKYSLPSRDMIQSAATGGWPLLGGIRMQTLPAAGNYPPCGDWTPEDQQQHVECIGAQWSAYITWVQPVRERYELTVRCPNSIARYGANGAEDGASHSTDFDRQSWEARRPRRAPSGWATDSLGDLYSDEDDPAALDEMLDVMLRLGRRKIWDSHRQNLVQFAVVCDPGIDLAQGRNVNTPWLTAAGKIYAYEHRLDPIEGTDITVITLACPRGGGGAGDPLNTPARPSTAPVHTIGAVGATLITRLGNSDSAPDDDETWTDAYIGNYVVPQGGPSAAQVYEDRFVVHGAEIEPESKTEAAGTTIASYNVAVPDHLLTETPNP